MIKVFWIDIASTGEVIVHHKVSTKEGELVKISHPERDKKKSIDEVYKRALEVLGETDNARILLDNIRTEKSRYAKDQFALIIDALEKVNPDIVKDAVNYCVNRELWSAVLFKDTVEYLKLEIEEQKDRRNILSQIPIPSRYYGVKPEIRSINDYINALKEDNTKWKN